MCIIGDKDVDREYIEMGKKFYMELCDKIGKKADSLTEIYTNLSHASHQ